MVTEPLMTMNYILKKDLFLILSNNSAPSLHPAKKKKKTITAGTGKNVVTHNNQHVAGDKLDRIHFPTFFELHQIVMIQSLLQL